MNASDLAPGVSFKVDERSRTIWKYEPFRSESNIMVHFVSALREDYRGDVRRIFLADSSQFELLIDGIQFFGYFNDVLVKSEVFPFEKLILIK